MRIEYKPRVYLVGRTVAVESGIDEFLSDMKLKWPTPTGGVRDADRLIELAGRCCYMSFGSKAGSKTNHRYLQNLLGRNEDGSFKPGPAHGAVCEHPTFSFLVVGAGRGWSHEQVRQRAGWGYSQLSTRYCDFESEDDDREDGDWEPGFCVPPMAQLSPDTEFDFKLGLEQSRNTYVKLLHLIMRDLRANHAFMSTLSKYDQRTKDRMIRKAARGAARDQLVIGTEAIMFMTANARALWNTIVLRASEHAEAVIRDVYVQIARIMEQEMPNLFYGLKYETTWDGTEQVIMPREHI